MAFGKGKKYKKKYNSLKSKLKKQSQKKKGSLALQTAKSALRKVEELEDNVELKYANTFTCQSDSNNCGQIYTAEYVNNYAQNFNPTDFLNSATGGYATPAQDLWMPTIINPIYLPQGTEENERIGNQITLSHITIKGRVTAWPANLNYGHNQYVPCNQRVYMYVILDRDPVPENSDDNTFQLASVPFQVFSCQSQNPLITNSPAAEPNLYAKQRQVLLAAPHATAGGLFAPGLQATRNMDIVCTSFQSKDYTNCPDSRFKILHKSHYDVQQSCEGGNPVNSTGPYPAYRYSGTKGEVFMKPNRNFSVTVKAPYKFKFEGDGNKMPCNQCLYVMFISDVPSNHRPNSVQQDPPVTPPVWHIADDIVIPPSVSCVVRVSYKDA